MNHIKIFGVKVHKTTLDEAKEAVTTFLEGDTARTIYTPNTEIVMTARKDSHLKDLLNQGDLVIADGIGLVYASRLKKKDLPERVTGFDISVKMLEIANEAGLSIFLLGGQEGIAKEASINIIENYPNIKIAGSHHGYFKGTHIGYNDHEEEKKVIDYINSTKPDIVFVGFGAPRQEKWIHENKSKVLCKIMIGNGGTIDILAGRVKRAPDVYQKLGLEWLYRLVKEPSRIKRQLVIPLFVLLVIFSGSNVVE